MVLMVEKPLVGVNTNDAVPSSVAPGWGLVITPGIRVSTAVSYVASPLPLAPEA